ncbi:hypothetical protein GEV33_009958 [Tenebrio molitor]|uniref:Uncharacterized protein n=1 Tax=Tenebrio molitor TaxID=7067 RepID=A0A8J6HE87_TENMO|nr:hypothetical protein GEV33_009958 [Tenebrio molitor]
MRHPFHPPTSSGAPRRVAVIIPAPSPHLIIEIGEKSPNRPVTNLEDHSSSEDGSMALLGRDKEMDSVAPLPLPPRYRLRDLIMGDYAFNDDGERGEDKRREKLKLIKAVKTILNISDLIRFISRLSSRCSSIYPSVLSSPKLLHCRGGERGGLRTEHSLARQQKLRR